MWRQLLLAHGAAWSGLRFRVYTVGDSADTVSKKEVASAAGRLQGAIQQSALWYEGGLHSALEDSQGGCGRFGQPMVAT